VLRCSCGGARRLLAVITLPEVILAILRCLGLAKSIPARGPPDPVSPSTGPVAHADQLEVRLVLE
jgi:hypothetical protein